MKYINRILVLIGLVLITNVALAQKNNNIKVEEIEVQGNCNACKVRIEEAADINGVKRVSWNKETNMLTVTYDVRKTNLEEIGEAIAEAGHDNAIKTANHDTYHKLPSCCAYRSEHAEKH